MDDNYCAAYDKELHKALLGCAVHDADAHEAALARHRCGLGSLPAMLYYCAIALRWAIVAL